jgi:D-alanyl-D-alanine carboxypeptidase (penicillin-binding protein 5/6)
VLAEHVAGEEALFAHLMSKKAFLLGCFNTHFVNASGLPADGHYSTAYDLALIGRYLLASDYISELVATKQAEFKHPAYRQSITITNTNGLLGSYPGADGIKTGTTNAAGKCLVASASRIDRQLIAVVLKSSDRIGDCTRLLDYGFQASSLKKIVDSKLPFKRLKLINGEDLYIDIYPEEDVFLWEGEGSPDVQKKVKLNYQPEAPVQKGQKIGCLGVYADGKLLENVPLVCKKSVRKTNLVKKLFQVFLSR